MIKYYTFYRENNNFSDLLNDPIIKKIIDTKIKWYQYLMIGMIEEKNDHTFSYITLKYGDDIKKPDIKDFTPIPGVDYVPKRNTSNFKKKIS